MWLEKPERIAVLVLLTVLGLRGYALIQWQVRLYLHIHSQQVPGNKGTTAMPTAAVVLAVFSPVTRVHLHLGSTDVYEMYGVDEHHWLVCDALGLDRTWYGAPLTEKTLNEDASLEHRIVEELSTFSID